MQRPWIVAIVAFSMMMIVLLVGNQIIKNTEEKAFIEFNQRQLVMARGAASGIELFFSVSNEAAKAITRGVKDI